MPSWTGLSEVQDCPGLGKKEEGREDSVDLSRFKQIPQRNGGSFSLGRAILHHPTSNLLLCLTVTGLDSRQEEENSLMSLIVIFWCLERSMT